MIGGLLAKPAGAKGILIAGAGALAAIGALLWLLLEAKEAQGEAESRADIATSANQVWQEAWAQQRKDLQAQRERLDAIDQRLADSTQESRNRLSALQRGLKDARQSSEEVRSWLDAHRPQPVLDRLCVAGYIEPAARADVCSDPGEPDT